MKIVTSCLFLYGLVAAGFLSFYFYMIYFSGERNRKMKGLYKSIVLTVKDTLNEATRIKLSNGGDKLGSLMKLCELMKKNSVIALPMLDAYIDLVGLETDWVRDDWVFDVRRVFIRYSHLIIEDLEGLPVDLELREKESELRFEAIIKNIFRINEGIPTRKIRKKKNKDLIEGFCRMHSRRKL